MKSSSKPAFLCSMLVFGKFRECNLLTSIFTPWKLNITSEHWDPKMKVVSFFASVIFSGANWFVP